jgi:hypothetical protein
MNHPQLGQRELGYHEELAVKIVRLENGQAEPAGEYGELWNASRAAAKVCRMTIAEYVGSQIAWARQFAQYIE